MEGEAMVMGGGLIYRQLLPYCDGCYVTKIDAAFEADTYFPNLDADGDFRLIWESQPQMCIRDSDTYLRGKNMRQIRMDEL